MIPVVPDRWEVGREDIRPQSGRHRTQSALARRIHAAVSALLRAGIEPDEITIDIDRYAVIVRTDDIIHIRPL